MKFPGFIGPSYQLPSLNVDCQRSVNLYFEPDKTGDAKQGAVGALVGCPGLSSPLLTLATSPIRGQYLSSTGLMYVVAGNTLYQITYSSGYVSTTVGTLLTSIGPVSMADNGTSLVLCDGYGYKSTLGSSSLAQITDAGFLGATQVTFQDGYFVFFQPSTNVFFTSDFSATTFAVVSGTSMQGAKASYPDNMNGIVSSNRNVFLFGTQSTEIWYDAGNAPPTVPFTLIQGGYFEIGIAATFSLQKILMDSGGVTILFLGQNKDGQGIVYMLNGYTPVRISTTPLEYAIRQMGSDISGTTSWTYQENGHQFYALNFKNVSGTSVSNSTWVFDLTTNLWHERVHLSNGQFQRHLAEAHTFFNGIHIVGDYSSGNLYQMSNSIYSDNGAAQARQRIFPHIPIDTKLGRVFYWLVQVDIESGVGLDGGAIPGTNPQAMLQFSNDGGHSWSNEKWTGMGKIGQTSYRAIWRRLGASRDRVFKITVTDPVKVVMIDAELNLGLGAN